jgi:hypothetical protein
MLHAGSVSALKLADPCLPTLFHDIRATAPAALHALPDFHHLPVVAGLIQLMRKPLGPYSAAVLRMSPTNACLLAEYALNSAMPLTPASQRQHSTTQQAVHTIQLYWTNAVFLIGDAAIIPWRPLTPAQPLVGYPFGLFA